MSSLIDRIRLGLATMPDAHRKLGALVLEQPCDAAMMTINGLADAAGVSTATCNRFARGLGYERYGDFRNELIGMLRSHTGPEDKLKTLDPDTSSDRLAAEAMAIGVRDLRETAAKLVPAAVQDAIDTLCNARRLFVLGFGNAHYAAAYAAYLLEPLLDDVREVALTGGAQRAARRLGLIGTGDALLVFSLPRFSNETLKMTKMARAAGGRVIVVTSDPLAPITAYADVLLTIAAEHKVYASSIVAVIALVEAIASAVAARLPGSTEALTNMTRWVMPYLVDAQVKDARSRKRS